ARHAGLFPAGPDLPRLPPPRADVLPHVRLQRELPPAPVPRRGGAREEIAAGEDAGGPLAEAGQPPRSVFLHVGPPGQEASVSGRGIRPGTRMERRAL